jgi:HEAT repeats
MNRAWKVTAAFGAALVMGIPAGAQSLSERVGAVRQGTVEFHFASRPGVCGNGDDGVSVGRSMHVGRYDADDAWSCEPGPVRVRLQLEDGAVRDIRTSVGRARPSSADGRVTDLGIVSASAAAAYFLQLGRTADSHVSNRAIMPAVLADSTYPWRELLAIAGDTATRSRGTRSSAELWLSRFAGAKLSGRENDLSAIDDETVSDESQARGSAVFALAQLRNHEGIPPLLQVARSNRDAYVRRQALFWLGQSGDPRALRLFEEILSGK